MSKGGKELKMNTSSRSSRETSLLSRITQCRYKFAKAEGAMKARQRICECDVKGNIDLVLWGRQSSDMADLLSQDDFGQNNLPLLEWGTHGTRSNRQDTTELMQAGSDEGLN